MKKEETLEDREGQAPDGGWGWLVVGGCALSNIVALCRQRGHALLHEAMLTRYQQSVAATASVASLFGAVKLCSSPAVSALATRIGHRWVTMTAGVVAMMGMILTAFSPSLTCTYFTYAVIVAIGENMLATPAYAMIYGYFDKRRALAMSIATLGYGLGGMISPVIQYLLLQYGYRGTMVILGALMLHFCVTGALFRPLQKVFPKEFIVEIELCVDDSQDAVNIAGGHSEKLVPIPRNHQEHPVQDEHSSVKLDNKTLNNHDSYSKPQDPLQTARDGMIEQHGNIKGNTWFRKACACDCMRRIVRWVIRIFDLTLLSNVRFMLFTMLMTGAIICAQVNVVFISSLAKEKCFSNVQVALLMLLVSSMDIPARLLTGVMFDMKYIKKYRITIFACLSAMYSICSGCLPFVYGVVPSYTVWCMSQCLRAAVHCQHPTVLADIVYSHRLTHALGLLRFFQGIGTLAGPSLGGFIRDQTGDYSASFVIAGGLLLLATSAFMFFHLMSFSKSQPKTNIL